jgi:hypothetical protein
MIPGAFLTATVIDKRGQRLPHSLHTAPTHQLSHRQVGAVSVRQRRQIHLRAVKAFLIHAVDPDGMTDANLVADRPDVSR